MRNVLIILNPIAGSRKQLHLLNLLEEQFEAHGISYSIDKSLYPRYIIEKYKNNYTLPYTDVISCGGDGTLFEVVNAFYDKGITLSIFPIGSANDYYKYFYDETDFLSLIIRIIGNKYRKVDLIKINDNYTINNAGFGIDTETIKFRNKIMPVIYGKFAYKVAALYAIGTYKPTKVNIVVDGKEYSREIMIVNLASGKYLGGGMMINPMAIVDDGEAELIILNKCSKKQTIELFGQIFKGTHIENKYVEVFKGKEFKIVPDRNFQLHSEGEPFDGQIMEATVLRQYLKLIV